MKNLSILFILFVIVSLISCKEYEYGQWENILGTVVNKEYTEERCVLTLDYDGIFLYECNGPYYEVTVQCFDKFLTIDDEYYYNNIEIKHLVPMKKRNVYYFNRKNEKIYSHSEYKFNN